MKRIQIFFLLILFIPVPCRAEWRFEIFMGKFFPGSSDLTLERPAAGETLTCHGIDWSDRSFDPPLYYGFRLADFFGGQRKNGIEIEFVHAKVYSDPDSRLEVTGTLAGRQAGGGVERLGDWLQEFSISHGLNFLFFNFVRREAWWNEGPFNGKRAHLVFRAGFGPCICHTESTIEGVHREQYEFGGVAFQAALEAVVPVKGKFHIPLEYKFTHAWLDNLQVDKGAAGLNLRGSHITLGTGFRFSGP